MLRFVRLRWAIAALALIAAACGGSSGLDRTELIDALVDNEIPRDDAECVADRVIDLDLSEDEIRDPDTLSDDDQQRLISAITDCVLGSDTETAGGSDTAGSDGGGSDGGGSDGGASDGDGSDTSEPDAGDDSDTGTAARFSPDSPPPGDDVDLDALWVACGGGDDDACSDLFFQSPLDSDYEAYGLACGGRDTTCLGGSGGDAGGEAGGGDATGGFTPDDAPPGDNADLDMYWTLCAEGSARACDELYLTAPGGTGYFTFGLSCGGREAALCTELLGDDGPPPALASIDPSDPAPGEDPVLDALWEDCAAGDALACFEVYDASPVASAYERFGFTCGGRGIGDCVEIIG